MTRPGLTLIVPGDPDQPTGGYRYDARIAAELRALGWPVAVVGLPGRFPDADEAARNALDRTLADPPDDALVVVDGLALGGLPDVAERHADRLTLVGLVHHPLADETGLGAGARERFEALETRALAACRRVITTSPFTARRVARMGVDPGRVGTVEPGVAPAEAATAPDRAARCREQRLLCVGSLTPRKGQDVLIEALTGLADRPWRLTLVGDPGRDPTFARRVRRQVAAARLHARIRFAGACAADGLDAHYRDADLVIVPSHYEGYGMVVTEALARGLPLVATTGGALADTVPGDAALRVAPGDAAALADALRRWLDAPETRAELAGAALAARARLGDWPRAGRRFEQQLAIARETS